MGKQGKGARREDRVFVVVAWILGRFSGGATFYSVVCCFKPKEEGQKKKEQQQQQERRTTRKKLLLASIHLRIVNSVIIVFILRPTIVAILSLIHAA